MLIKIAIVISLLCAAGLVAAVELAVLVEVLLFAAAGAVAFVLFALLCLLIAWLPGQFMDPDAVCTKDNPYFRTIVRLYAPAVFSLLLTKIKVTGLEKVPTDRRFMLVCNHIADLDSGVMLQAFRNYQLGFLAKKETRNMPIIGRIMGHIGCQFLDRENDRNALKVIINAIRLIKDDQVSIMAFPEGAIIEDGKKLHHFRSGVFKVAMKPQVPVVVCTIRGTPDILPNIRRLKPSKVDLRVLDVVTPEQYAGMRTPELADKVYHIMRADLGPEADGSI